MRSAGTNDRRGATRLDEALQHHRAGALVAFLGDDDEVGAGRLGGIGAGDHAGGEPFDRPGLHDVERFARSDRRVDVDEPDCAYKIVPRQHMRQLAAKLAGADDRDLPHPAGIVCGPRHKIGIAMTFQGRSAIVTGGSRGIGLAVARALVAEGVNVAVLARNADALSRARAHAESAGPGRVEALRADVGDYADVERAVAAAVARFGGLDYVVNNAGVGRFASVADTLPAEWAEVINTNLTGVFHMCHACIPHLRARGGGFIINISSLAGKNPFKDGAAYCASKSGLNAFSEALMQEVRYDNIRVSYILPGSVATGFSGREPAGGAEWKIAPEDVSVVVLDLLRMDPRSLPSRVELRPSKPRK